MASVVNFLPDNLPQTPCSRFFGKLFGWLRCPFIDATHTALSTCEFGRSRQPFEFIATRARNLERNAFREHEPTAVFVYGTLKRGQVREKCWPRKPVSVERATVRGVLYDLGPYPGLTTGDDVVSGEIWTFAPYDMPTTLAILDEIEGYRGSSDDEYSRVIVECVTSAGTASAWVYIYSRQDQLRPERRIELDDSGICCWPAGQ